MRHWRHSIEYGRASTCIGERALREPGIIPGQQRKSRIAPREVRHELRIAMRD
jgi:hypothetical protein